METSKTSAARSAWNRALKSVSVVAWTITGILVLILGLITGLEVSVLMRRYYVGLVTRMDVVAAVMPFMIVLGVLSVLVGTLSTVGVFLRLRTASLVDIQLRLAALEDMLASRSRTPS
jgi:uncharacterized membrane protein (DUF106 family)